MITRRKRREASEEFPATAQPRPARRTRQTAAGAELISTVDEPLLPARQLISRHSAPSKSVRLSTSPYVAPRMQLDRHETPRMSVPPARRSTSRTPRYSTDGASRRGTMPRASLGGESVHEMTLDNKAEFLAQVAADCLVKLLRVGMAKTIELSREEIKMGETLAVKAWHNFQSKSHIVCPSALTYAAYRDDSIFPEQAPPFVSYSSVITSLHDRIQGQIRPGLLLRAVSLSNLATFAWVISDPDRAADLLMAPETNYDPKAGLANHVQQRYRIMLMAWKKFWTVIVPPEQKTGEAGEEAMKLWLALGTQIFITFQQPTVIPASTPDDTLPGPSPQQQQELFSASAMSRLGNWDILEDWAGDNAEAVERAKDQAEALWQEKARRREIKLSKLDHAQQTAKFDYVLFKEHILAFLNNDVILAEYNSNLPTPFKVEPLDESYDAPFGGSSDRDSVAEQLGFESDSEPAVEDGSTSAEGAKVEDTEQGSGVLQSEDDVDFDFLELVSKQMEHTAKASEPVGALNGSDLRDGTAGPSKVPKLPAPRFNFAARQQDAQQVEWESQTPVRSPVRNGGFAPRQKQLQAMPAAFVNGSTSTSGRPSVLTSRPTGPMTDREEPEETAEWAIEDLMPDEAADPYDAPNGAFSHDDDIADLLPEEAAYSATQPLSPGHQYGEEPLFLADAGEAHPDHQRMMAQASGRLPGSGQGQSSGDALVIHSSDEEEDLRPTLPRVARERLSPPPVWIHGRHGAREADQFSRATSTVNQNNADFDVQQHMDVHQPPMPQAASPARATASRISKAATSRAYQLGSHAVGNAAGRAGQTAAATLPEVDQYMIDADGSPLTVDESYRVPRLYKPPASLIHGRIEGQTSIYSRVRGGPTKMPKPLELLLYREIQKVPLTAGNPCAVVSYLHGEFGIRSQDLAAFNNQHMKDKMRSTVERRMNRKEPVVGKARMFLPPARPERQAYEIELKVAMEAEQLKAAEEAAAQKAAEEEAAEKAAEEAAAAKEAEEKATMAAAKAKAAKTAKAKTAAEAAQAKRKPRTAKRGRGRPRKHTATTAPRERKETAGTKRRPTRQTRQQASPVADDAQVDELDSTEDEQAVEAVEDRSQSAPGEEAHAQETTTLPSPPVHRTRRAAALSKAEPSSAERSTAMPTAPVHKTRRVVAEAEAVPSRAPRSTTAPSPARPSPAWPTSPIHRTERAVALEVVPRDMSDDTTTPEASAEESAGNGSGEEELDDDELDQEQEDDTQQTAEAQKFVDRERARRAVLERKVIGD